MTRYEVTVDLNSLTYVIDAEDEEAAVEMAHDLAMEESHYDILKWADYHLEEVKE